MLLADTAQRAGKAGLRPMFLDLLSAASPGLRRVSTNTLPVRMSAPALDSNSGLDHPVELTVLRHLP